MTCYASQMRHQPSLIVALVFGVFASCCYTSVTASSSTPISLQRGINKVISERWSRATALAELEQQVEDYNAEWIASAQSTAQAVRHRRLIVLPLDDRFDPPMGMFSHGHVQTGDKLSLPPNFMSAIHLNNAQVPWLFSVKRIEGVTSERVQFVTNVDGTGDDDPITPFLPLERQLEKVVGGPLDFRAPNCYIIVPLWMMRALGLKPRDIVQVDLVEDTTVPPGSLARLRPHSEQFAKDIANPQAVLETELRHYSSLTRGTTIAFDYNKKRYWFDVVDVRSAPRGEKAQMIKVQDCDIATDFLPSRDVMKKRKQQQKKRRQQQQQEEDDD